MTRGPYDRPGTSWPVGARRPSGPSKLESEALERKKETARLAAEAERQQKRKQALAAESARRRRAEEANRKALVAGLRAKENEGHLRRNERRRRVGRWHGGDTQG